ncbi:MAG TPA: GntR family transcriptional regulator [Nocardioidaceae bacterium]|jgi:DNA-binding GntR family transcriptional regulator
MARTRVGGDGFEQVGPLDRPGPLRAGVLDSLRELIIARVLPPGQHLVESELAERLGVSRGPVREALQALHSEGWVELRPRRGAFVRQPTPQEVDEVFVVRAALESEAAGLAAENVGEKDILLLREVCNRGRHALDTGDEPAVVAANSEFHRMVADLSGVSLLNSYVESLDRWVRWFYRPVVSTRGRASWDEHDRLLCALEDHDKETAAAVMRLHTEHTRQAYRTVSAELSEDAASVRGHGG